MIFIFIASLVCVSYSIHQRSLNPINESLISRAKTSSSCSNPGLISYWDKEFCGPCHDNDNNIWYCHGIQMKDKGCRNFVNVGADVCVSKKARLVGVNGDGTIDDYEENGCLYRFKATYECHDDYMVVAQEKSCNPNHLILASTLSKKACEDSCTLNTECNYYLWNTDNACSTFKECGITVTLGNGNNGGFIYKKQVTIPERQNFASAKWPLYTIRDNLVLSGNLPKEGSLSVNPCEAGCTLAMPKTALEQRWIHGLAEENTPVANQAWDGIYAWLGGHYDYGNAAWKWNDGTLMPSKSGDGEWSCSTCWDTAHGGWPDQPEHLTGGSGFAEQDFLGLLRDNGKWHDFHGRDQGDDGKEASEGQQAVCEAVTTYVEEADSVDKYCCASCDDVVILDTHCMPNEGCDEANEGKYALWGSRANCERSCTIDPNCKYYLWRHDPSANARKTCATFKNCDVKTTFQDKHGDKVYKKVL